MRQPDADTNGRNLRASSDAYPGFALRDGPGPRPRPAGGTAPSHRQGPSAGRPTPTAPLAANEQGDVSDVAETSSRTATGTSASSSPTWHRPRRTKSLWFPRRRPSGARGGIQARALRDARTAHVRLVLDMGRANRPWAVSPETLHASRPGIRIQMPEACSTPWRTSSPPRPSGSATARPGGSSR